ncbi:MULTISPECIES: carbohydrate ABC transporter permease [Schleiferilactobacillus]|jgi:raffinose/stachyose/melibiose transport system permease protein|uniref:Carbohydrate ABC transporter permease n=1 Tax=Schleiferilactobacillus harbinensis TaxID=304207 RepID=A0ABU7T4D9_9LACO|nr:carbohydrate ABC transporter permease [Schleiferilactobacillus perolens]MCI1890645.1 carbohydrate ABC transporter permease [Schleiferilactobacillus harbinensis]MCI1912573.1 carbohydrate ABC transporter permease [Schleiferilactobacillus harbinensis]MCI2170001.1 carbohydrate ABC transporter permease [Schleiferilactobacillus perolens]
MQATETTSVKPKKLKRERPNHTNYTATAILAVLAIFAILGPLYLTVVIALKDPSQMNNVLAWPSKINWSNFKDAWEMTDFPTKFLNTLFITVVNIVFTIITNSFVAYVITRYRSHSKLFNGLYYYLVSAMFIPFNVIMLPLVKQVSMFHMDNVFGITILYIIFGLPMNTFLYAGFVKQIPIALEEAAIMDGATPLQVFFKVVFPIMKPMHATVAILSFMWTWNDFLMPLVLLSNPKQQTLQLAQYVFQGQFSTNYNLAFASYMLVLAPVLLMYIFFQRYIIAGVTSGAVK